jgi:hypothetical protein
MDNNYVKIGLFKSEAKLKLDKFGLLILFLIELTLKGIIIFEKYI